MTFGSSSVPATSLGSSGSPEKFLFYMVGLYPLCCQVLYHHGTSMMVTRFTFLHWEFCDLRISNHQNSPLWARLYQHVFCKKPSLFCVFKQTSQFGSFGKCVWTLCLPVPDSTFARNSIGNSREELQVSRYPGSGFHRGSKGPRSSTKFSLNSCSQSGKSRNR